jgi:hypothetical protein
MCVFFFLFAQDRVLLYLIKVLDPIVQKDYNVIYLHTNFTGGPVLISFLLSIIAYMFNTLIRVCLS